MTIVNVETGEIVEVHPEEPGAVAMLTQAISALTTALDEMPIGEVVNLKAKVATVATATKELGMSKEAQELAAEAVRRAEWSLGRAIRKGQAEGSVGVPSSGRSSSVTGLPSPSDFASPSELYPNPKQAGIYDLVAAAPEPEQFEAAITAAKEDGGLSRANVVRKAEQISGKAKAKPRKPLTDSARDLSLDLDRLAGRIQRFADDDRLARNKNEVAARLRHHLARAIEVLSDLNDQLN